MTTTMTTMPFSDPALPDPKAKPRPAKRYRRKVASARQWQRIVAEKIGPCRVCTHPAYNGGSFPVVQFHHIVSREDHGDDVPENIVPLCRSCHDRVTRRAMGACLTLLSTLTDAEYAYMIERGGEGYPERAYGVTHARK